MEKILKTLKYIFISFICLCITYHVQAQEQLTVAPRRINSIALGLDLSPFIIKGFNNERTGLTLSGRYGLKDKIFAVAELGYENIELAKSRIKSESEQLLSELDYSSNGSFLKAGLDFNIFKVDEPGNNDNVLVGVRYGLAYQEHYSNHFLIGNGYWNDYTGSSNVSSVTSHWFEVVFGLRTELFRNFYLGWGIRSKILLLSQKNDILIPYAVPGMGKVSSGMAFGFNYSIEYQIPFGKKQRNELPVSK
ncbi:MAG: hypothetical protein JW717_03100 [Marinilabiliaceae bacterium]|nr:hypothetical protein [Marinilabiliaceae bacterium]